MKNKIRNKKSDKSHKLLLVAPSDCGRRYQLIINTLRDLHSIIESAVLYNL